MSYLHIEVDKHTLVGKSVQLYTDIDERWSTGHDYDYQNFPMTVVRVSLGFVLLPSSSR